MQLSVLAEHIPEVYNTLADALSRNNLPIFHSQFPQADNHPIHITEVLVDLMSRPDWTSQHYQDKSVEQYFSAGLAASSQKTYAAG